MTIISIMGAMTILVYFNVTENSRRLQMAREISETARQITERIAQDVRAKWIVVGDINYTYTDLSTNASVPAISKPEEISGSWNQKYYDDYKNNWSNILWIGDIIKRDNKTGQITSRTTESFYIYGTKNNKDDGQLNPCDDNAKKDKTVHCGLYVGKNGNYYNLVDAFRTEESKRVKITDLKFYITGDDYNARKVTLKMTLQLMPREWVPPSLVESSKLEIQTTFSERPYKIN